MQRPFLRFALPHAAKLRFAFLPGLGLLLALGLAPAALAGEAKAPKAVVELFTSQGCSSCPEADAFLADLSNREEVIALSLPVDYWDYLGWKDTLARPENSERERAYAAARGDGKVYTPQMVVNGGAAFVGSDRQAVAKAIAATKLPVPIQIRKSGGKLEIEIGAGAAPEGRSVAVRFVTFRQKATVPIRGGENNGRTVTYRNVVKTSQPIGLWDGDPLTLLLPADQIMAGEDIGCAVLLQVEEEKGPGAILGAATVVASAAG